MSLAKRLSAIESKQRADGERIRELERFRDDVLAGLAEEELEDAPVLTLDGQDAGGERDQGQPL